MAFPKPQKGYQALNGSVATAYYTMQVGTGRRMLLSTLPAARTKHYQDANMDDVKGYSVEPVIALDRTDYKFYTSLLGVTT